MRRLRSSDAALRAGRPDRGTRSGAIMLTLAQGETFSKMRQIPSDVRSFRLETLISASPDRCFDLSRSVDAHVSSMAQSREQAVERPKSALLSLGDEVTWRARHFGISFTMTAKITSFDRPHRFVDEQQRGPFKNWWHEHTFIGSGDGSTLMTDTVRYLAPLGPLGAIAEQIVLDTYMPRLLRQRNVWIKNSLEA